MSAIYLQNRYKLEKMLGQGGMGRVYLATDTKENKKVAIKLFIMPQNLENKDTFLERFTREYSFLSSVKHPYVIKAFDFFKEQENLFLVLEFAKGISLKKFIPEKACELSLTEKLAISIQITRAIEVVNASGIIHRDIKPDNIMVDEQFHLIKLLDLGVAKSTDQSIEKLTQTGIQIGTPSYMSPEQTEGKVVKNSDIFSLGAVLYQLFLGLPHSPFQGKDVYGTLLNICQKQPPPLISQLKTPVNDKEKCVCQQLSELIDQSLEKEAKDRIQNITIIVETLEVLYQYLKAEEQVTKANAWQITVELPTNSLPKLSTVNKKKTTIEHKPKTKKAKKHKIKYAPVVFFVFGFLIFISFPKKATNQAITLNPNDAQSFVKTGSLYTKQKKYREAEESYNKAIAIDPKNVQAYYGKGRLYAAQDKYTKAEKEYNQAINLNPNIAMVYCDRGNLYRLQGKYGEAIQDYNQAITLNPGEANAYHRRSLLYTEQQKYREALEDLNKAIALNPKDKSFYGNRGLLYHKQNKYREAERDYSIVLTLDPKDSKAYNNRGFLYYNQKRYKEAQRDLNKAIDLDFKYAEAYNNRGLLNKKLKKFKQAEKDFSQAIAIDHKCANAYSNRGFLHFTGGKNQKAFQDINKAIALDPRHANAYGNRGIIYFDIAKYKLAIQDWEKAISLGLDEKKLHKYIAAAQKMLNDIEKD